MPSNGVSRGFLIIGIGNVAIGQVLGACILLSPLFGAAALFFGAAVLSFIPLFLANGALALFMSQKMNETPGSPRARLDTQSEEDRLGQDGLRVARITLLGSCLAVSSILLVVLIGVPLLFLM